MLKSNIVEDLGMAGVNKNGTKYHAVRIKCENCGNIRDIRLSTWKNRKTNGCQSCSSSFNTHGLSKKDSELYSRWTGMRERCKPNYKIKSYHGTTICAEWDDYKVFKQWAESNGFEKELELDKDILSKKLGIYPPTYSPETCQWITKSENIKDSNNHMLRKFIEKEESSIRKVLNKNGTYSYKLSHKGKHIKVFKSMEEAIRYKYEIFIPSKYPNGTNFSRITYKHPG